MTFVQVEFLAFFAIVFSAYWAVGNRVAQNILLVVASAIFYGWVHPFWLVLMYVAALVDYGAGLGMKAWPDHRRLVLAVSIGANCLLLGYYKYADFFVENVAAALDLLGVHHSLAPIGVLLPAGISFYTFQSMAYSFDIYRKELEPRKNLLEYLLAVSLFCHLVAGPVQRASNLLMQAETPRRFSWTMIRSGMALAMSGAVKKVVVADTVSPYVDKVFALAHPSGALIWAATLGFAVQILADFSGYSDIARGTARMLGFELMENFKHPYLAWNPSEFWRRWHVSFSTWIKDYLYIPFGGSKGGFARTTLATFGAMGLSGLWHGAAWNYVIWGLYHASLLTGYRLVAPRIPNALKSAWFGRPAAIAIMFAFTNLGWLLFRETSLVNLVRDLTMSPFSATPEEWVATAVLLAVTGVCGAALIVGLMVETWVVPRVQRSAWHLPVQTTTWAVFALALFTFVRMSAGDFIYFQF